MQEYDYKAIKVELKRLKKIKEIINKGESIVEERKGSFWREHNA